jgi:hypothetical protein
MTSWQPELRAPPSRGRSAPAAGSSPRSVSARRPRLSWHEHDSASTRGRGCLRRLSGRRRLAGHPGGARQGGVPQALLQRGEVHPAACCDDELAVEYEPRWQEARGATTSGKYRPSGLARRLSRRTSPSSLVESRQRNRRAWARRTTALASARRRPTATASPRPSRPPPESHQGLVGCAPGAGRRRPNGTTAPGVPHQHVTSGHRSAAGPHPAWRSAVPRVGAAAELQRMVGDVLTLTGLS